MSTSAFLPPRYSAFVTPKAAKLQLMPVRGSDETPSQRLARIRRARAFTQLAGPAESKKPSRRVPRRLEQIEALPLTQQTALSHTVDAFFERAAARAARRA